MAMEQFLSKIGNDNLQRGDKYFQGVEETSERYIPWLDVYHGRSFTATHWPVIGPGAVSIPLYIYLYHQYQIGYSGWIDMGFSPCGFEKYGLGRSFIFGLWPGVRVGGNFLLKNGQLTEELRLLKGYVELIKEFPEFLLRGRMIGETEIEGSSPFDQNNGKGEQLPVEWNSVQGISWLSENGNRTAYALANLHDSEQNIRIQLNGENENAYRSSGYSCDKHQERTEIIPQDGCINFTIRPWELIIVY
jgi:hypothetical protein